MSETAPVGPETGAEVSATAGSYLLSWLGHARGRVRTKTYLGYEGLIRLHALPRLGAVPLRTLGPLHLQGLYGDLLARGARAVGQTPPGGEAHQGGPPRV